MAYVRIGTPDHSITLSGCGPKCKCGPCRQSLGEWYVPDEDEPSPSPADGTKSATEASPAVSGLGHLGWDTRFLPVALNEGHEIITRIAFSPLDARGVSRISFTVGATPMWRDLTPPEQRQIIEGNRDTDIQYLRTGVAITPVVGPAAAVTGAMSTAVSTFTPQEQKHHALRATYGQDQASARRDIVADLRAQHLAIVAEQNPIRRLRRIGAALHLIQDSFSPAHIERNRNAGWCVNYIRNYGPQTLMAGMVAPPIAYLMSGREHRVPTDPRDAFVQHPAEATQAAIASTQYLRIVFKAIYGRSRPDATATSEAAAEFNSFVQELLRPC